MTRLTLRPSLSCKNSRHGRSEPTRRSHRPKVQVDNAVRRISDTVVRYCALSILEDQVSFPLRASIMISVSAQAGEAVEVIAENNKHLLDREIGVAIC